MLGKHATKKGLFSLLLSLTIILVILAVFFGINGIHDQTRRDLKDSLETVLSTTRNALDIWAKETETRASFWANAASTRSNVRRQINLLRTPRPHDIQKNLANSVAQDRLFAQIEPMVKANGYLSYVVLDLNGLILSASDERLIGRDGREFLGSRKPHRILNQPVMIPPFRQSKALIPNGSALMMVTAPIREDGRTIALLGFLLDPSRNLTETTQLGRIGNTGETYAFDQAGNLVTDSRFKQTLIKAGLISSGQSDILNVQIRDPGTDLLEGHGPRIPRDQQPFTKMAQSALAHQTGSDLEGYRDYRGNEVVGAWLWDPKLDLGLATEIDVDEAYRSYFITRLLVFAMLGFTIIGAIVVESGLWLQSRTLMRTVSNLEKTRQMLQESVRARNEFISIAAHELRTPLTSLRLQMNLIHNLASTDAICRYPKDKLLRITSVSSTEIERFSKIIRNLLDASQISKEDLHLEPQEFDLMRKIHDVRFQYSEQLRRNGCELTVRGPDSLMVRWDRTQIEQVLTNLLSNAIKYGKGRPIEIDVHVFGQKVQLSVTDHGIGIRKEDQSKVFEKYERAGVITPEGGLGLGLYLVRRIVNQHHGTVRVESELGKGSRFTISIPRILEDGMASAQLAA